MYKEECACPGNTLKDLKIAEKKVNPPPKKKTLEQMFQLKKKKCPKGKKVCNCKSKK